MVDYSRHKNYVGGVSSYFFNPPLSREDAIAAIESGDFNGLTRTDLSGLKLVNRQFANASAGGANFRGADLSFSTFDGAELKDADFRDATLVHTKFVGCNLKGAKFTNADLRNAEISHCVTQNAVWPERRRMRGIQLVDNIGGRVGVQARGRTSVRGVRRRSG
jgi:hypothetical protein